jgi:hypothetical protein
MSCRICAGGFRADIGEKDISWLYIPMERGRALLPPYATLLFAPVFSLRSPLETPQSQAANDGSIPFAAPAASCGKVERT